MALASRLAPVVFSCCALIFAFFGLFEFDVPLTRFVRSLNDVQADHLHNPWLARLSDVGDRLGRGESLVLLSLAMLAIGFALKQADWKASGWQTLLAHALAGLSNNLLKHLVGRARPKFMHAGQLELSPLSGSGWDSFPSGHSMASFAVAMVLAVRFPRARWVMVIVAIAIAASRILRGSHFLTDIVAGAVLGVFIGVVVANPWKEWRPSLESALFMLTPPVAALLALVWTIGHRPSDLWPAPFLVGAGLTLAVGSLAAHALLLARPTSFPAVFTRPVAQALIGIGLGMFTGSAWVAGTVFLVCTAFWLRSKQTERSAIPATRPVWIQDVVFGLAVLLALYTMSELRGALPML